MKYTPATIAKALFAFVTALIAAAAGSAHGADLSVLDFGQWMIALGAALTAGGGVFVLPNKSTEPVVSPAEQVVNGVQAVISAQANATAELDKVKQAVTAAVGVIPGIGPLAAQVINSFPTAYSQFTDASAYQRPYDR
jgi:hypothetical protein